MRYIISGNKHHVLNNYNTSSSSNPSKISTSAMFNILERLKLNRNRKSTQENYYTVWKLFNKFIVKLDKIPDNWEDRVFLFLTHMVLNGQKSTTVRSYFSAIKSILWDDHYELSNNELELRAITRACKLSNDQLQP